MQTVTKSLLKEDERSADMHPLAKGDRGKHALSCNGSLPNAEEATTGSRRGSNATKGPLDTACARNVGHVEMRQMRWCLAPLWSTDEEEQLQTVIIDFNTSICGLLFGRRAHDAFLELFRRRKGLARLTRLCYNLSLLAICLALLLGESIGTPLSIFSVLGALPGNLQLILGLNPTLLGKSARNPSFWTLMALTVGLWATVGVILGGTRGICLSVGTALTGTVGGPMNNSWHYRFRSSGSAVFSFLFGLVVYCILAGSVAFKVFHGGKVLRWALGSRYLSGEDVVIHSAATLVVYFSFHLIQSARTRLRRLGSSVKATWPRSSGSITNDKGGESDKGGEGGTISLRRTRRIPCTEVQWPLVIYPIGKGQEPQNPCAQTGPSSESPEAWTEGKPFNGLVFLHIALPGPSSLLKTEEGVTSSLFRSLPALHQRHRLLKSFSSCLLRTACSRRRKHSVTAPHPAEQIEKSDGTEKTVVEANKGVDESVNDRVAFLCPPIILQLAARCFLLTGLGLINLVLYLSIREQEKGTSAPQLAPWLLRLLSIVAFLWSIACFLYLSRLWNLHLLWLALKSSFDLWFLLGQTLAGGISLSDALEYDCRCLVVLAWSFLYLSCLFSDFMLPVCEDAWDSKKGQSRPPVITKQFMGMWILVPLIGTQCWFLYNLFYGGGTMQLRFRTLLRITKTLELGVDRKNLPDTITGEEAFTGADTLEFSTDSFIIARVTSIIVFSLPLILHLAAFSSSSRGRKVGKRAASDSVSGRSSLSTKSRRTSGGGATVASLTTACEGTTLYFLTGSVTYEVPVRLDT